MKSYGAIALMLACIAVSPAAAEVSFAGKTVEIWTPYAVGGGTDVYARVIAPMLQEQLPGKPKVVVQNLPGSGGTAGANRFQKQAKPTGLTLAAVAGSVTMNAAVGDPKVEYKLAEWIPIHVVPNGRLIYARSDLGVKAIKSQADIDALNAKRLVYGGNSPTSGDLFTLFTLDLLGIKVKEVWGLNRGDVNPAFQRGEFNINYDSASAYERMVEPMIQSGIAVPLFSLGLRKGTEMVRDPMYSPDLPTFNEVYEYVHGKPLSGIEGKAWFTLANVSQTASKILCLPTGTPKEIVDTYRAAMTRVVAEFDKPKYKAQKDDLFGPYPQTVSEEGSELVYSAVTFDPDSKAYIIDWLKRKYNVSLSAN
jgi:tripartite-type tricarboxylate transporter receptor subunit TctC